MNLKFNNVQELYELLLPALETKETQLRRNNYLGISKNDIWNYLKDNKWKNKKNLRLYQMVSDILNTNNEFINSYKEI